MKKFMIHKEGIIIVAINPYKVLKEDGRYYLDFQAHCLGQG